MASAAAADANESPKYGGEAGATTTYVSPGIAVVGGGGSVVDKGPRP